MSIKIGRDARDANTCRTTGPLTSGDGIGAAPIRDIMQEVVVRLRYPVRFTRGILEPDNPILRDAITSRARLLVVVDAGLAAARLAILAGMEEFREHLGGRLAITLIDGVGSPFEVHEMDGDVVLEASDLLRRHSEQGALNAWQLTPARAR
jgi:hypothetical protein